MFCFNVILGNKCTAVLHATMIHLNFLSVYIANSGVDLLINKASCLNQRGQTSDMASDMVSLHKIRITSRL